MFINDSVLIKGKTSQSLDRYSMTLGDHKSLLRCSLKFGSSVSSLTPFGIIIFLAMTLDPLESYNTLSSLEQALSCMFYTTMIPQAIGVLRSASSTVITILGSHNSTSSSIKVFSRKSCALST